MKTVRKLVLSLAMLLFLVSPIFAQSPVKIYFMGPDGHEKLVSATDTLPVLGNFVISGEGISTEATLAQVLAALNEALDPDSGFYFSPVTGTTWNIGNFPSSYAVTGTFFQTTQPVSGTFYQATQPVSIASMPSTPVTGTFYQVTQPVSIASMPSTPVTGTFWPDTQPISGNVGITGSVGVRGTFYPETQPVSGSVSVSNFPSSYAVTGSFYQATQPVSIASMPSTPVTGTFYPDTQPISGNVGITGSVGVTGTFYQATQPVSIASMPSTPVTGSFYQATQPVSIASMPSTPVTGTFYQATQPISLVDITLADTIIDTTMADTSTVYNVVLPAKCVAYEFQCKGAGAVDYAMSSGGVTTNYWTLKSGYSYNTFGLGSEKLYTGTIYFKCTSPTAGDVFQIRIWTKP